MGPFVHSMNPDIERLLKRSRGGAFGLGFDWSCGPQLASVNGVIFVGSSGNLTKASSLELRPLVNEMPRYLVPFRYRPTCLHASKWAFVAHCVYFDNMFVIVAKSGRVLVASH